MSYLYAVQMLIPDYVHPVKIGLAVNPRNRLAAYSSGPFPVQCLGTWRGCRNDEAAAHKRFVEHRLCGEWFYPADEILSFIQVKTGLIQLKAKAEIGSLRFRRLLGQIVYSDHEPDVRAVLTKAREIMARFRTGSLSDLQLRALLSIDVITLKELKREGVLTYTSEDRYSLEDLMDLFGREPSLARGATANWHEVDSRIYGSITRRSYPGEHRRIRASKRLAQSTQAIASET